MPSLINHAAKLGSLLCRSKFESQQNNYEVINFRKNCTGCLYILKASLYLLHRFNNTFLLKNSINCETSNLIYVVNCQGSKDKYIGGTGAV